jgi:hypothetical protein
MSTTRREFLDRLAIGSVAIGGLPLALGGFPHAVAAAEVNPESTPPQSGWDTRWNTRLTGKVKTVFDVPEIESGYGVWRASVWARQYEQVLGTPARDLSTALVIRHNAIILAMQQGFWDKYGIGQMKSVTHPLTGEATDRNPALLGASDGLPEPFSTFALDRFMANGGIVLACDLALQDLVGLIQSTDKISPETATAQARAWLVPGVILQPSGVFAVFRAQEAGALYIRAT